MNVGIPFRTLISKYAVFLVDSYGVLRNSAGPIEAARQAVAEIKRRGKQAIIFSNTADNLPEGVAASLQRYSHEIETDEVITAGMALIPTFIQMDLVGRPIISVGNNATDEYVQRAGGVLTEDWQTAEAAVLGYLFGPENKACFDAALNMAMRRDKPVILANTDKLIPRTATTVGVATGAIGLMFEVVSGREIIKLGKPFPPMYQMAFARFPTVPHDQFLAIGDSMDHDIAGAKAAGIDSLLVLSGVQGIISPGSQLDEYMRARNLYPTHVLPELSL